MKLKIQYREVFGRLLIYPCCDKSKALTGLMGKKTFSEKEMQILKQKIGFEVEIIPTCLGPIEN